MSIAIFGGTYNPVHHGHLRIAIELTELLGVDQLCMIPCANPPHREAPEVSAEQRLAMLQLAIQGQPKLRADDLELRRADSVSYTIDTVLEIRSQMPASAPLHLCLGMDSLQHLHTWHRWQELLDHCHIVVTRRPGSQPPQTGPVAALLADHQTDDIQLLRQQPGGCIYLFSSILLPISSTEIRQLVSRQHSIAYLTPPP